MTEKGAGKVIRHNVIGNCIVIRLENGAEIEMDIDAFKNMTKQE
jgi:hypothetical protein